MTAGEVEMGRLRSAVIISSFDCSQNINLTNIQMDFCGKIISDVLSLLN